MYLGLDIGTSGVKSVMIDDAGQLVAKADAPLAVTRPRPLWSEQNPADWLEATSKAVLGLPADLRTKVRAIGLSGQMHGATLLGADDKVLRPAILWNDGRSHIECSELEKAEPRSREITGNLAMPGFTAPKLLWLRKNEPELFSAIRTVLLPKDYVRLHMTGAKLSDMSDAAGTLWLDVAKRQWSDAMLAASGLSRDHMPDLCEGSELGPDLRPKIASAWGVPVVPVVGGASDNAGGAIGAGVIAPGDALLSLGTSGVTFVATDRFQPNPAGAVHAFCHCLPDLWHQMAVHLSAASCVDWAVRQLGLNSPAEFFDLAQSEEAGEGPELFLPYLSGERTPHNDPHIRAGWLKLDNDTGPARLANAILEGVAFTFADGLAALEAGGSSIAQLNVIGGGSRSTYWGRIIASALGRPLAYRAGAEVGPAFGAARLAMIGATGAAPADICTQPAITEIVEPDAALASRLAEKLDLFRALYPAISKI